MPARRILQLGDPVLREKSRPVEPPAAAGPILTDLRDTLHEFQITHGFGRGISAIQIGQPWRIVYIELEGSRYSLVNPFFERLSEERTKLWDDCFSFPDLMVYVERSTEAALRFVDENGEPRTLQASGPLAELLQHEVDHLDGILAVDLAVDRDSLRTREEHRRRLSSPLAVPRSPAGPARR